MGGPTIPRLPQYMYKMFPLITLKSEISHTTKLKTQFTYRMISTLFLVKGNEGAPVDIQDTCVMVRYGLTLLQVNGWDYILPPSPPFHSESLLPHIDQSEVQVKGEVQVKSEVQVRGMVKLKNSMET